MKKARFLLVSMTVLACGAVVAAPASASFHLTKINEIMVIKGGDADSYFFELTDPAEPFPCVTGTYRIVAYDAGGLEQGHIDLNCGPTLAAFFSGGGLLYIPTSAAAAALGVPGDITASLTPGSGVLPNPDGQVCFTSGGVAESKVSCLAYGTVPSPIPGAVSVASPPDGQSVARQCNGSYTTGVPTPNAPNASCSSPPGGGGGGGGSGGNTTPPQADHPPTVSLAGASSQKLGSSVSVKVGCPTEACVASATGALSIPNASKVFAISSPATQIAKGASATLKLKLSKKARKAARKALGKGRRVKAKITVTVKNTAGSASAKRTVKLKK